MRVRLFALYAATLVTEQTAAQDAVPPAKPSAACNEFNREIADKVESGQLAVAEAALFRALILKENSVEQSCIQTTLHNLAAVFALSGRFAEAEVLAQRSLRIVDQLHPTHDSMRLRPLHLLWSVQFQQGKRGNARQTFQNMRKLQLDGPRDHALLYGAVASHLQVEGRYKEAEQAYLRAIAAWEVAGGGSGSEVGDRVGRTRCETRSI